MSLPVAARRRPGQISEPPLQREVRTTKRGRILLVDDDARVANVLRLALAEVGHEVVVASSGREAIGRLDEDAGYDLVLCDLQMKDGDGVDVYEHVTARHAELVARTVFMTGGAFTPRTKAFAEAHRERCYAKPFDPVLVAERCLRRHEEPNGPAGDSARQRSV